MRLRILAGQRITLCLLGEGERRDALLSLSAKLSLGDRVRFLGYRADVRPFYHAIDAHLSTSLGSETSSLSLSEGMSAGCATLASDIPGNRTRVGSGGLLFPAGDAEALARLLLRIRDREARIRLSQAARIQAQLLPTWEEARARYRALFAAFCGELGTNGCNFRKDMLS